MSQLPGQPLGTIISTSEKPFLEKHKNHLLLLLAVVAGYFAYKKFKK